MLYDCIIIALALSIPGCAFFSFKTGYQIGRAVRKDEGLPRIIPRGRDMPEPMTAEQQRMNDLLQNIDSYDGTGEGQVKI